MSTHRADAPSDVSAAHTRSSDDATAPDARSLRPAVPDDTDRPGPIPVVMLRGKWLLRLGFPPGCLVRIEARDGVVVLSPAGRAVRPPPVAHDDTHDAPGYTQLADPQVTRATLEDNLRCRFREAAWRVKKSPSLLLRLLMQRYVDIDEDRFALNLPLWGYAERRVATLVAREVIPPSEILWSGPRW